MISTGNTPITANVYATEVFETPGKSIKVLHTDIPSSKQILHTPWRKPGKTEVELLREQQAVADTLAEAAKRKRMLWVAGGAAAVVGVALLMMRGKK